MSYRVRSFAFAAALVSGCPTANAAVTISSAATSNMSCVSGVCTPTAKKAVLNVGDLTTMLASGNVAVNTGTGSLAQQVQDIVVAASFNWSSAGSLTLDAYRSVTVDKPIAVNGTAPVSLVTNDGGSGGYLTFVSGGSLSFLGTANSLSIDGTAYTLENSIATLASAIASNSAGDYALANNYDASRDGTYSRSPIPTVFTGGFQGLGNAVSNLTIQDLTFGDSVGLFGQIGTGGTVADIGVENAKIIGSATLAGTVVGTNQGTIANAFATGSVTIKPSNSGAGAGGIAAWNFGGTVLRSNADVTVTTVSDTNSAGGLAGVNQEGAVIQSYATGAVKTGEDADAGGLVAANAGSIVQCYSTGAVNGDDSIKGGLIGANASAGTVAQAYATGAVKGHHSDEFKAYLGGFVGYDGAEPGSIASAYWDISTSRVKKVYRGAGNVRNDPGIKGLTSAQLQSGLPSGFDPTIWAQSPSINGGFPYLIANPPR